jgi:hypothetical protein
MRAVPQFFRLRFTFVHVAAASALALVACQSGGPTAPDDPYEPILPTSWAPSVTNPLFPLEPGTLWRYEGETDEGSETVVVEVLSETRRIMGVDATIVRDRVYLEGTLIEDTFDWYAQASDGTVWYLGEDTREMENGQVVSTEGSFEWGQNGALPGVIMWGNPAQHVGEEYRQEYYEGEAEDWGKVIRLNESLSTPSGSFAGCIVTEDWNGLETGSLEHKTYCPEVGFVFEVHTGGGEEVALVEHNRP